MFYSDIPQDLQALRQWICWRESEIDGKLTKLPLRPIDGKLASVTNPLDWTDFDTAVQAAVYRNGIGFVFTASDPFVGIDLDNKAANLDKTIEFQNILKYIDTYVEISPSGKGFHAIARGVLPGSGRRKFGIEIYDKDRFFTFTGNRISEHTCPQERQAQIAEIFAHLAPIVTSTEFLSKGEQQTITDDMVCDRAMRAANGDKFARLFRGDWETDYGNKSQSEADFALINIIAFYSRNFDQTVRIFRQSKLGQREKAKRGAYVGGMVKRSFDRLTAPVPLVKLGPGPWFDANAVEPWQPNKTAALAALAASSYQSPFIAIDNLAQSAPPDTIVAAPPGVSFDSLPPIPGLVGDLMRFTFASATFPVKEIAIASALTLASTLFSRTHRFGTNSLALYVLVLAKTSTGKSFGFDAQNKLRNELLRMFNNPQGGPQYKLRVDFLKSLFVQTFASAPAMTHHMLDNPSTLLQADEFVKDIKRMTGTYANGNDQGIYKELLKLTDVSKPGNAYIEAAYSKRGPNGQQKDLRQVVSACLSIFATGTPSEFYDNLTPNMLNEGLIPRFLIFDYTGFMPNENEQPAQPSRELLQKLETAINIMLRKKDLMTGDLKDYIEITCDASALDFLKEWKRVCMHHIRVEQNMDSTAVGIWSRGAGRVVQIASLIAAGVNPNAPVITLQHAQIAREIVEHSIRFLHGKIAKGETDTGDTRIESEIRSFCDRFYSEGYKWIGNANAINPQIAGLGYIQLAPMRNYLCRRSIFKRHKLGENRAFDDAIFSLVKMGNLERKDFKAENGRIVQTVKWLG